MASCVTHDAAVYMPMNQLVDVEQELPPVKGARKDREAAGLRPRQAE